MVDVSRRGSRGPSSCTSGPRPSASRRWASARCTAYRGDLVLAQRSGGANVPMIMSGSSLIRLEEVAAASPRGLVPGLPAGRRAHHRAGRARRSRRVPHARRHRRHAGARQPREQRAGRLLDAAAAEPAPRVGGHHAPALAVRHLPAHAGAHGMPHFENNYATRGAPILSSNVDARLLRPRPPDLDALGADPPACGRGGS